MPGLRTRAMSYADLPTVIDVEQTSYPFPWAEGVFRDCIRVGYFCRVLELRGELVGYALMSMGAGEAHLLNVCVRMDCREQGLGRYLVLMLIDHARSASVGEMFLEVRPSNPSAIHLYKMLGFEHVGVRKGYYQASPGREDAWVYRLKL
ncbi:MAG: ribosomal protein S18-alanine N-acetyltransferase [Candidatus Obscuribacterales bacterium]|nr:ribosomal protein S18-alanine N-acetyltransferase [Steroidobacteraceae bacterium]